MDDEEAALYTQYDSLNHSQLFVRVLEVHEAAEECWRKGCAEPAWNSEVHCRLLWLAFRGQWQSREIWYEDVTTARITDRSLLPAVQGAPMQSKFGSITP